MSDYCQKCGEKIRSKIKMKCDAEQTECGLCMDNGLNSNNKIQEPYPMGEWLYRLPTLSINPDAATRDDVARMAAELMECRKCILDLRAKINEAVSTLITVK